MLERELAAGGMARVYLAKLRGAGGFEKRLVVKQIRPELASDPGFVERFVKEAKTAVELSHPNIVPVYELGVEQGVYYIAMEHCDGATLSELLSATGPLDVEEGAYLGVEVCRALDYAHRRAHVIHRDVTPRNVLIDEEGAIKLIDFGIAAPVADGDHDARAEVFGSPGHMPPEQIAGRALSPATDVFAVGVLLYEALTGRPPFRRATAKASREALYQPQPPLDADAQALRPLAPSISSAMQLDESLRPASAEALGRPLRDFLRSVDAGDVARRLGQRVRTQRRRARASSPWLVGEGLTGLSAAGATPKTPHASQSTPLGTQTFAASRGFEQLTRKVQSEPLRATESAPASPSTRRLPSSRPPPPPAEDDNVAERPAPASSARRWVFAAIALLGSALAFSTLLSRGSTAVPVTAGYIDARTLAPPGARSAAPFVSAQPSGPPSKPPPATSAPARPAAPRPSVAAGAPRAASAAPRAVVSLTALPGTRVTLAGQEYTTPVSGLSLPPGRYQVTFRNATWDSPVSTPIQLFPGQQSRVHADFTLQPPRVVVR